HRGNHVPALRMEVTCSLEPVAGGAPGDQHGLHLVDSFQSCRRLLWRPGAGLSTMQSPISIGESPEQIDPLSEVIALLQPRAVFSRPISGAGRWGVRYSAFGEPSFCAVLHGSCRLTVDRHDPVTLEAGDFVLLPATPGFILSSFDATRFDRLDPRVMSKVRGEVRHGTRDGRPDVRLLGGWFVFDSPDAGLLVSLLPSLVHVRGIERLSTLVRFVAEETNESRPGRGLVLTRFVEVLLIEALRA